MADDKSPKTIEDFLRIVRASKLVEEKQLEAAMKPWEGIAGPLPEACVAALLNAQLVTEWQMEQLRKGRHKGFFLGFLEEKHADTEELKGKYKLLKLLAAGGMGSVYLGEHAVLQQKVAIKVLPVKRVTETSYLKRFEREAMASAKLNHPNIARAFDIGAAANIHFIVMEYVDGIDLYKKVKEQQGGPLDMDVREAADFIRQAALGLHSAHEEGLIHRDIKPANLILDKRGTVKILDLGLALASAEDEDEAASLTREHDEKVLGTADYLPPEQAKDSHKADRRSDIYSLGCTLYYLLVGTAPFAKGSLAERIRAHMQEPPPNPLDKRPDLPAEIIELYFRMLAKDPDSRPQTAQEVADALASWLGITTGTHQRLVSPRRTSLRRNPADTKAPSAATKRLRPGTVLRSGSGSGSSTSSVFSSGVRSGTGSGIVDTTHNNPSLDFTLSGKTSQAISQTIVTGGKKPAHAEPVAVKPVVAKPAAVTRSGPQKKPWNEIQIAGLPIVFWIFAGVGVLVAIGLAIVVIQKFSGT